MKRLLLIPAATAISMVFALSASAQQPIVSQFFNNNNGSFTDSQAGLYNWNTATANGIATIENNISAGNTHNDPVLPGEEARGRGFLFVLPVDGAEAPGATFMYTTHLGVSNVQQNNPQPDWYSTWATSIVGLTMGEISGINFRTSAGSSSGFTGHVALQIGGTDWVVSNVGNTIPTSMTQYNQAIDLNTDQWYTGVFDGTTLSADPTGNPLIFLSPSDVVTGVGYYAITGAVAGNNSRIRLDRIEVIPEPSTYAAMLGLLALGAMALRRRRR